jgi:hypothetical protein
VFIKAPPLDPFGNQFNPVHTLTSYLSKIHCNIIHPYWPRSPKWSPLRFSDQNFVYSYPTRDTYFAHNILLDLITLIIWSKETNYESPHVIFYSIVLLKKIRNYVQTSTRHLNSFQKGMIVFFFFVFKVLSFECRHYYWPRDLREGPRCALHPSTLQGYNPPLSLTTHTHTHTNSSDYISDRLGFYGTQDNYVVLWGIV